MNTSNAFKPIYLSLILIFIGSIARAQSAKTFTLISSAFQEGKPIPAKYTCDGADIAPPLAWSGAPEKTQSFAIIMDDPDAPVGTWVHWVIYNIPGKITGLEEGKKVTEINVTEGLNDWQETGYRGPCPPGGTHRYEFKLYALDKTLAPKEGMTKDQLLEEMKAHIIAETKLTGLFRVQ